jgi:pyrroline-5-carboxylate reductase
MIAGMTSIGVFGAQGHLGHSLVARLHVLKPASVNISGTADKEHNRELAAASDLSVVVVRPQDVAALLTEIKSSLKSGAQVLSFAAGIPLADIAAIAERPVARGMADPWWNFAGFVYGEGFSTEGYEFLFNTLGKKTIPLATEPDIDAFTAYFVHAYIVLFLKQLGELQNADAHLSYLAPHLSSNVEEIRSCLPEGNPAELLKKLATPGGVTEAILLAIRNNTSITPEAAHTTGMKRIAELKK